MLTGAAAYALNNAARPRGFPIDQPGHWSLVTLFAHRTEIPCVNDPLGTVLLLILFILWVAAGTGLGLFLWKLKGSSARKYLAIIVVVVVIVALPVIPATGSLCPQM
jgi:hypothetical protein